ncbi:MAG: hypothetical protein ACFFE4_08005 [Candidatus Thorarchaeota archaeon]
MDFKEYEYNIVKDGIIFIKDEFKKKGKEYGIVNLDRNQIFALAESIDLQSVTPLVSPKFSERIEKFLLPRFNEINEILYTDKTLPSKINVEMSKENYNDIIKGLDFGNVFTVLREKGYFVEELRNSLRKINFSKHKIL